MSKARHEELKRIISEHDIAYYGKDEPLISDKEYDVLFAELLELESADSSLNISDSPSQRVGGTAIDAFVKVPHRKPMLSLSNSYNEDDIRKFYLDTIVEVEKYREGEAHYVMEPKFDGLSIELVYVNGVLNLGLTRGDGAIGEDVSTNIRTIKNIPLKLNLKDPPALIEVRGEVLIHKKDFAEINSQQESNGLKVYKNPRNLAAGTVRQLDPKVASSRPLAFYAYGLGVVENESPDTEFGHSHILTLALLKMAGFTILPVGELVKALNTEESLVEHYRYVQSIRSSLPFDIDGMVIKVNHYRGQEELGFISRSPKWATAAKFDPEQARSKIKDIVIQVGRTGALTPVAILEPVFVGGVTVTNVTLHNQDEINRKHIYIGSGVVVQRAGDVIPEIVSTFDPEDGIFGDCRPHKLPSSCPVCGTAAVKPEDEAVLRCPNPECPAVLKEQIVHFVGRKAMNIDGVGDKLIYALFDKGIIKKASDLYRLTQDQIMSLDRQGSKSAKKALENIELSKKTNLTKFIFALGIRRVGEGGAQRLADHFITLEKFLQATAQDLSAIPDIGGIVADSIMSALNSEEFKREVSNLIQLGVSIEQPKKVDGGVLLGKSFVVTGTLPVKRDVAETQIKDAGGKILSGVSKKLDFLVVGDDPGSKVEKAQTLGVKMINYEQLLKIIGGESYE